MNEETVGKVPNKKGCLCCYEWRSNWESYKKAAIAEAQMNPEWTINKFMNEEALDNALIQEVIDEVMNEEAGDKVMSEEAGDKVMNEEAGDNVMNERKW